ncbi:MAG: hypothetical protein ACOC29_02130, partial [Candidatus Sumerlaeota bacterium]
WLPWAMAAAVVFTKAPSAWRAALLAAPLALMLTASHPQIFYASAALSGLFILFGGFGGNILKASRSMRVRLVGFLAAAFVLCFCLAAAQLLPAMAFSRHSNRSGGVELEDASFGGLPPGEIVEMVLPSIRGDSTGQIDPVDRFLSGGYAQSLAYVGSWHAAETPHRFVSDYVGVWAAVLALAGLILARGQRKPWFFLAGAIVATIISTGDATPLFAVFHRIVPGFNRFRSPATFMIVTHFCVLALAAMGCQSAMRHITRLRFRARMVFAGVLGGLGLLSLAVLLVFVIPKYLAALEGAYQSTTNTYEMQEAWVRRVHYFNALGHPLLFLSSGSFVLALAVGFWPLNRRLDKRLRVVGYGAIALFTVLAVADPGFHARRFLPKNTVELYAKYLYVYAPEQRMRLHAGEEALPTFFDETRPLRNVNMLHYVRSTFGYHPVIFEDYEKLIRASAPQVPEHGQKTEDCGGLTSPLFRALMAQNYRTVPRDFVGPSPEWETLEEGLTHLSLERAEKIPVARIARKVRPVGLAWEDMTIEGWHDLLYAPDFDPEFDALAEGSDYRFDWTADTAPPDVEMSMLSTDRYALRLAESAEAGQGILPCIVSIPAAPGWKVQFEHPDPDSVDYDSNLWPKRINQFLMLVPVGAGATTELIYAPFSQRLGVFLSLAGLLFAMGSVLFANIRRAENAPDLTKN